jgi:hypothetical protein
MIGLINHLLFEYVDQKWGHDVSDQIKAKVSLPVDTQFHMNKFYQEDEWQRIFQSAVELTGVEAETFEWDFGQFCGQALPGQFQGFMKGITSTRDMLVRQPKIHNTISMSLSDTEDRNKVNSKFSLEQHPDRTIMHYASPNGMCTFYRSLASWMGDYFSENIEVTECKCTKHGDEACEIHVIYHGKKS